MLEGKPRGRSICSWYLQLLIRGYRVKPRTPFLKSPNLRLSLSLSLLLLLHRLLFRFFSRLRSNLLTKDAAPFRRRNPRVSRSLTSRLAPAIGASLAGFALGVYPGDQLRITIAIYVATRSLEFAYKALEEDGWFKGKPSWWGSWLLMPVATGQLLHAFVFDRDCFPKVYIRRCETKARLQKLTVSGLRRLHPRPHPQLRSTQTSLLPPHPLLAKHKHNRRLPSRNVTPQLAVRPPPLFTKTPPS